MPLLAMVTLMCGSLFLYQYSAEIDMEMNVIKINCNGPKLRAPLVYVHGANGWKRNTTLCAGCFRFPNITLRSQLGNTPMFIYDIRKDDWVSLNLKKHGVYDPIKLAVIHGFLETDSEMDFIDIGANIGKIKLWHWIPSIPLRIVSIYYFHNILSSDVLILIMTYFR